MGSINIPYHKSEQKISIQKRFIQNIIESDVDDIEPDQDETEIVEKALDEPIDSPPLSQLAKNNDEALIITSDHTRPVPSSITLPILLNRIREANPEIKVKILIATGLHRAPTKKEQIDKFGKKIVENENIIVHDSKDHEAIEKVGTLPSGGELHLNRNILQTDLLIADGFIEPHFFAGFSGGRKSVLPGVAGYNTVLGNHCAEFISSNHAKTGILKNNPIQKDMLYAADKAGLDFILNVIINSEKEIIRAFAGDYNTAHQQGVNFLKDKAAVKNERTDIVITSNGGYPLDQNIYQSVKGMTAGEACCKEGGVIIMVAGCADGAGGESFYKEMAQADSPQKVLEKTRKKSRIETIPEQWEYQILARILSKHTVIMVTDKIEPDIIKKMHMKHAKTLEQALEKAREITTQDAKINVIPEGVSVIVR